MKADMSVLTKITNSPARRWAAIAALLLGSVLLSAVVRAYNHRTPNDISLTKPSASARLPQENSAPQLGRLHARLAFQPVADRVRRRLGQRFLAPGLEQSIMVGILTIGSEQRLLRIVRTQNDEGERVEIALGGSTASLTWTAMEGARSAGNVANQNEQSLIERLALDSPDQFVLAQLRGASYFTVAQDAKPPGAAATDDYAGPLWDLIRVAEPQREAFSKPQSLWRLYHFNSLTGLLDKVISQEGGDVIEANFSGWVNQGGEMVPTHITWRSGERTLMEFSLTNTAFGPKG